MQARVSFADRVIRDAVEGALRRTPVDTARLRAAWVTALERLGGVAPSGWEGPDPEGGEIRRGRSEASVSREDAGDGSERAATNSVDYAVYLERGTREIEPRRMAAESVASLGPRLPGQLAAAVAES
ncbi:MAG: hypothetical protein AAGJ97_01480 [Planctomycetota bacterium]